VNQPHFPEARFVRHAHVLRDDGRNIPRREGVEIDTRVEGQRKRFVVFPVVQGARPSTFYLPPSVFWYVAVTVVEMPPRAVKSPTTVMRRGAQAATRSSRIWLVTAS
jgi:hypothetical protein